MKLKQRIITTLIAILITVPLYGQKTKVACVGNSVTFGAGIANRANDSYPAQLQKLLGDKYHVQNFGKSGSTLLRKGHRPYNEQQEYKDALNFAADKVVIHLGLNDTDPRNWPNYKDDFFADYIRLIESFRKANPACEIWICRLSPISHRHARFKSGTRDWYWQIQEAIELLAENQNLELIDLQAGLYKRPELLPDAIHPNKEGATIIANTIYSTLTGDFGGLQMSELYTDHMVLQRNKPLKISGTANAGDKIKVSIDGKRASTQTGNNGKWTVTLPPLQAGGPHTFTIQSPQQKLTYKDVLVGEVWLCSGQSNMEFRLNQTATAKAGIESANTYKAAIRFFDKKARYRTNAETWNTATLDSLNQLKHYTPTTWSVCDAESAAQMSAIAYYFGAMLADSLQVPIGLINNAVGGSTTESWIDRKTLEFKFPDILNDWINNDMTQAWARGRAALNIKATNNKLQRHPYEPCYLYESGILPLAAYPINGVIWYQGESNAHNVELHETLFPLMIESWRTLWGEELPFYYVQLSSLNRPSWCDFRDSQRQMLRSIPAVAMAVSSDRGDSLDVHPTYKKEVGERLALAALHKTYHRDNTPSGPLFEQAFSKGKETWVEFAHNKGMQAADGGEIRTFEVAETPGIYHPAKAVVMDGKIKLTCKQVSKPRYVRYAWQPFTRANLINTAGLPASTFQSTITKR
jgi:sialate O-acetylesterase